MRAPALAGESADCSSATVVTTMSGSCGDAARVDGEIANAITIIMIANVIEVSFILFINFFSFLVSKSVCLTKKEAADTDVSVRYDGLRVFSVSLINLTIQQS